MERAHRAPRARPPPRPAGALTARWPATESELVRHQLAGAAAAPPPWAMPDRGDELAVGGCFVVFPRGRSGPGRAGDPAWAAAALVRRRRPLATAEVAGTAGWAYAPGLLALREGPVLEAAVRALPAAPDVLLVNATGRDHPRRFGLASHLGAVLDLPTVGVTHRPLEAEGAWPGPHRAERAALRIGAERVGCWLRTVSWERPLAISPGWRTDVDTAVAVVLSATKRRRTPEPIRQARRVARTARATRGAQRRI